MAKDEVEEIHGRTTAQRQRIWDKWQEYLDALDDDIKNNRDIDHSPAAQLVMELGAYIQSQHSRENSYRSEISLRDHHIVDLTKAHKPNWQQILPLVGQITLALIGLGCGITPACGHLTGATASGWQAGSQAAGGIGGGLQTLGGWAHSSQQAKIAAIQHVLESEKRHQGDQDHKQRTELQANQRHHDDRRQAEQKHYDTITRIIQ